MNLDVSANIEKQLKEQGYHVSTTVGWSMYPMLRNRRDRIVVLPKGEARLKKFDLPLYHRPDGKYILHRIIGVEKDHYVIRGDNTYVKEYIPEEWIIGYVSEFYRAERHVLASSKWYRFYAAFWNFIYPLRRLYMLVRGFFRRCKNKLCTIIFRNKKNNTLEER